MERKRASVEEKKDASDCKMAKLHTAPKSSLVIDTNMRDDHITYKSVETTDHYRKGKPYKLFCYPGKSHALLKFKMEDHPVLSVTLMLNHCRTNCHGKIDILVNDVTLITGFQEARWDNFGEQNFNIPADCLYPGMNKLEIRLNKSSHGVYWLSDLRLDIEYN